MRFLSLFLALILFSSAAFAGGSSTKVYVQKLTMLTDTDYILVVMPVTVRDGDYWGGCKQFEVHGTLRRLKSMGRSSGTPTKKEHLAALALLRKFEGSAKSMRFGYIGVGFKVINPKNPCIVNSRGLRRQVDGTVLSFFYAV
jgi:hypothetical protein